MLPQLLQAYTPNTHTIVPEIRDDSQGRRIEKEERRKKAHVTKLITRRTSKQGQFSYNTTYYFLNRVILWFVIKCLNSEFIGPRMVSVVIWYLAILCGVVLNMEKSEKYFSVFPLSLLRRLGWVTAKKTPAWQGAIRFICIGTLILFEKHLFRICLN